MEKIVVEISLLIFAYLLGSIPNALIIGKVFKGIDIREYGSKNMGATNCLRVMGPWYGLLVFFLDSLKAGLIVGLFQIGIISLETYNDIHPLIYGLVSLLGHLFPVFAKFKGGKGVSCAAGILCAYSPLIFIISFLAFVIIVLITRYVSLGSIVGNATALLTSIILPYCLDQEVDIILSGTIFIIFLIILISHRQNITRLVSNKESRITFKKNSNKKM